MLLVDASRGPSRIDGLGLISGQLIRKGTVVWEFMSGFDVEIPETELSRLSPAARRHVKKYAYFEPEAGLFVLSSDDDRYTNHSDIPNTRSRGRSTVAVRDILPGEEITADYREINMLPPLPGEPASAGAESVYTPLAEAAEELRRRRSDSGLLRKVAEFRSLHPPPFVDGEPRAYLSRALFSGDYEFGRFLDLAEEAGLEPLALEISGDAFSSRNRDKRRRGRLTFRMGKGERGLRAIDFVHDGKPVSAICALGGMPLTSFHMALLSAFRPGAERYVRDASEWFLAGCRMPPRYLHYLSLGIADGIVFESYLTSDPEEEKFLRGRVLPSFSEAERIFGVRPLVVRLFGREEEDSPAIWQYPGELYPLAARLARGGLPAAGLAA